MEVARGRHKISCQAFALVLSHRPAEEPNSRVLPSQRYGCEERKCDTLAEHIQ